MILEFSAITAFSLLFIASIFDVKSLKGDVPEIFLLAGITTGILFHLAYSIKTRTLQPILWSSVTGLLLTGYGYFAYRKGMWGGADMLGISVLGFSTPYILGIVGIMDLIVNIMGVGFVYALGYGIIGGLRTPEVRADFLENLKKDKLKASTLMLVGLAFSIYATINGANGEIFFPLYAFMVLTYYFTQSVEDRLMVKTVDASQVEPGDVLAGGEIKGIKEEEIEELEGKVEIKEGLRFMPVFPVAMILTFYGFSLLQLMTQIL